jgi:predicted HTH transcriptional regulator
LAKKVALKDLLVAEATDYEFKSALETKKPKSWLKTVSAFANGRGGSFYIGVSDDGVPVGIADVQTTVEQISNLIKERISPIPEFHLDVQRVDDGRGIIVLHVPSGEITPYYYVGDGSTTAYVRIGNESNPATPQRLSELARRAKNISFDSMPTDYKKDDLSFTVFEAAIKKTTKKTPGHNFVRLNSKVRWKKMPDHRINQPDYADRAVFEAITNALMHREWSVIGSEVHVDMFDDRLEIYSPGGMYDGSLIQKRDIKFVPSVRRNPAIADVFDRLEFAERQGSGLKKIWEETSYLHGYTEEYEPKFLSSATAFHVILKNMNYLRTDLHSASTQDNSTIQATGQDTGQVTGHDAGHDAGHDELLKKLLEYCGLPRTRNEMQAYLGIASRAYFRKTVLDPLVNAKLLRMTIPDKPKSKKQMYVSTHDAERA